MASTVGPNKANKQWNRKRKGDGSTAERGPNINERNGKASTEMNERATSKERDKISGQRQGEGRTREDNTAKQQNNEKKRKKGKKSYNSRNVARQK